MDDLKATREVAAGGGSAPAGGLSRPQSGSEPGPQPPLSHTPEALTRRLLSVLMNSITDHIYFKDQECRFLLASRAMAERLGMASPDEMIGKTDFDIFSEEHARQAYEDELEIMCSGKPILNKVEKETWSDGSITWVSTTKMPLYDDAGKVVGTFGVSRDVTAQKLAEDELEKHHHQLEVLVDERTSELRDTNDRLQQVIEERRRAENALLEGERIATIRSMASGAAMNFNSILGMISGYASSIAAGFIPKTRVHDQAMRILESTDRASELTHRLMHMADASDSETTAERRPVSLGDVIRESSAFLEEMLGEQNVILKVARPERMPRVAGDRAQLVDVMMALMINASQAMPDGGTLRIDAAERVIKKPGNKNPDAEGGTFVMLRVRDTGCGISSEIQEMIFEPFFTTRESESAFGLGLTYTRSAVMGMGGWIDVTSRPEKGAIFSIHLPKSVADDSHTDTVDEAGPSGQTILLVDDEESELRAMQEALDSMGYKVLTADNGDAALVVYGEQAPEISLCIIDALMAGGAAAIVKRIRRVNPQPELILTSGFSRDFVRGLVPMGPWGYLQKPFESEQLLGAVSKAYGRKRR